MLSSFNGEIIIHEESILRPSGEIFSDHFSFARRASRLSARIPASCQRAGTIAT
jgi:hypothetical protein